VIRKELITVSQGFTPKRFAVIREKNKREIVLLRGKGCSWRRCRFCDYHMDCSPSDELNFHVNTPELNKVTGIYKKLEVINSGSFVDLDAMTMETIEAVARQHNIDKLIFECHWNHRDEVNALKARYAGQGITVKVKTGVETFDALFRESYLDKGITTDNPAEIAYYFDECCLLLGLPGQTAETMLLDITIGLAHFERVCINIMQNNTKPVQADPRVIQCFTEKIHPLYKDDPRVDMLLENTAFGVGGQLYAQ
jgi:hypothetical protein